jgi:N,N-dimethylformamidase beta subunit-like, C-terminal
MRDGVQAYLADGGSVLCLSGNTAFWRAGYDQETKVLETRKTTHPDEGTGVAWLPPGEWGERWHTDGRPGGKWSYLGQAPSALLGSRRWAGSTAGTTPRWRWGLTAGDPAGDAGDGAA